MIRINPTGRQIWENMAYAVLLITLVPTLTIALIKNGRTQQHCQAHSYSGLLYVPAF